MDPSLFRSIPVLLALGATFVPMVSAEQYTKDSPVVLEMIKHGLRYLEGAGHAELGAHCLAGIAFHNAGKSETHPKIAGAIKECRVVVKAGANLEDNYSNCLAIIFLCHLDGSKYRQEIETLYSEMLRRQKPNGGWGYPDGDFATTGDISQTQYAALALWYVQNKLPSRFRAEPAVDMLKWLLRVQDPSGGWGYQGIDPGPGADRVKQDEVRHSLVAAGLGSTYIAANILHLTRAPGMKTANSAVLRRKGERDRAGTGWRPLTSAVNMQQLKTSLALGDQWFDKNLVYEDTEWTYYYMYGMERYQSFREFAEGSIEAAPDWYSRGVEYLKKKQAANGSWSGRSGGDVATSFGVLFLQRNSQMALKGSKLREGRLVGGRGLPTNVADVRVKNGKVLGSEFEGTITELLGMLEAGDLEQFDARTVASNLTLSDDPETRKFEIQRLRRLIAHQAQGPRLAAVQLLAGSGEIDNVPYLIFALGDPDLAVVRAARDGLRRISGKFNGMGLGQYPDRQQVLAAVAEWKKWYRSFRPRAEFLD